MSNGIRGIHLTCWKDRGGRRNESVVDAGLGLDAVSERVFDLPDLAHRICQFDYQGMGVAAGCSLLRTDMTGSSLPVASCG